MTVKVSSFSSLRRELNHKGVIVLEGPQRLGKTHLGSLLSRCSGIPYYSTMSGIFPEGRKSDELEKYGFQYRDQTPSFEEGAFYALDLILQTKQPLIIDRGYLSYLAYQQRFGEHTVARRAELYRRLICQLDGVIVLLSLASHWVQPHWSRHLQKSVSFTDYYDILRTESASYELARRHLRIESRIIEFEQDASSYET